MRRLISVLSILTLAATIVPVGLDAAAGALACCNGIMCPMHAAQNYTSDCGMDVNGSSAALKPCPTQVAAHYTAATLFVLLTPVILHRHAISEPAFAFLPDFMPNPELQVSSPPPRFLLTAA